MTRMAGEAVPVAMVDGRPTTMAQVKSAYANGDHLVNGGAEVGLFWASNIQERNAPRPIEHAFEMLSRLPAEVLFTPGKGKGL